MVGLVLGKLVGVFGVSAALLRSGLARWPEQANWTSLLGVAAMCGIGFTMSLFIGTLAFGEGDEPHMLAVRLGIISGSLLSGVIGASLLGLDVLRRRRRPASP